MTTLMFIGDIVGEPGLVYLEQHLPALIDALHPDFVVANAENLEITAHTPSLGRGGMSPVSLNRLFALGVDLVTGGNHSWDGPHGLQIHDDKRILRPLNYSRGAPGRGAAIIERHGVRFGVVNLASRSALPLADDPVDALDQQLEAWRGRVDMILVDFHGEEVKEKLAFGFSFDGRVTAVLGTHTHVPTLDTRILPLGTGYVTDVGMTGPANGIQGFQPERFVHRMRLRLPTDAPLAVAAGPVEFGAVLVTCEGLPTTRIERLVHDGSARHMDRQLMENRR